VPTLRALGWTAIDPVSARLVGAALAGIGVQSLLGRNESADAFRAMLRLKCIWSGAAILGLGISIAEGAPAVTWGFLLLFLAFAGIWNTYRLRLRG
jgi:malic enzyme